MAMLPLTWEDRRAGLDRPRSAPRVHPVVPRQAEQRGRGAACPTAVGARAGRSRSRRRRAREPRTAPHDPKGQRGDHRLQRRAVFRPGHPRHPGTDLRGLRVHPGRRRLDRRQPREAAGAGTHATAGSGCSPPAGWAPPRPTTSAWSRRRGEYVARQDFDDRSYPDRLRLQVALLDAHPEVGIVGGYYLLVDERRGERYVRMPPTEHEAIVPAMARYVPIAHTIATFRRRAWSEAGGYPLVEQPDRSAVLSPGGQAGMAVRQRPRGRGRALRPRRELVPPHAQVRRAAAGSRPGPGPGGPRAGAAPVDVPVRARPLRLCLHAARASSGWCGAGMARSRERDV